MKIQYTDAALQELQAFQSQQQKMLEQLISERKFVYGDEIVEVTASDIKEASVLIRAYRSRVTRNSSLGLLSKLYIALGALIAFGGYFYPKFQSIFFENRVQAMAILTGVIMMCIGLVAGNLYRARIRRFQEMEQFNHMERLRYPRDDKDIA